MKKQLTAISTALLIVLLMSSCEGPQGLPGRDGTDGADGSNTIGETLEVKANFLSRYDYIEKITLDPEIYNGNAIFVYWLSSENPDVWRPLPHTIYFEDNNELDYTFDYTLSDVQIYLGFTYTTPPDAYALDQIFRIVIIPSELIQSTTGLNEENLKSMEYNELMSTLKDSNISFKERTIAQ
ncbi:MAG: hypothetical protein ACK5IQ_11840 [Bacteroidales bacterium]